MAGYTEKYAEIEGTRVCFVEEGEGEPLLFIHGIGGSILNWAPQIEYFKSRNKVIVLDLPGFGKSGCPDIGYTLEDFSSKIRGVLDLCGVSSAHVVGNSLGGLISIHLALKHPSVVRSLVLVDSAGGVKFPVIVRIVFNRIPPSWQKRVILFMASTIAKYRFAYRLTGIYVFNEWTEALLAEARKIAEREDLDEYLEAYRRTAQTVLEVSYGDRLSEINVPTLIIWGQKDMGLPLRIGQKMNKKIKGSYLVTIPEAAHVSQLDQPEIFNSALERFLVGAKAPGGLI